MADTDELVDAHQGTSTNLVAAKARQATQDKGMPVKLRWTASLQEKPESIAVQGCVEDTDNILEVAHKEVNAHQVTGPVVVDCASSKPHIRRIASRTLRRHGTVSNLNLLASVVSAHGPNFKNETFTLDGPINPDSIVNEWIQSVSTRPTSRSNRGPSSSSVPSLTSKATTAVSSNTNLAYQGKTSVPTHYVDKEELEDQPTFPVKVPQINSGEDILKKAKVKSDGQVFSTKTEGRGGKRCFRMQDLPSMLMVDKLWMKEIIPALLMWAGTLADPWTISDAEFMQLL
ncbi:hypothetical protein SCLCIDRAFT_10803 [Scleroderma citrinum Foug A]|uniref:Uncharacterized protein n=1 Tax=Scleroderma citrinum Foug A TaxID=1036808 RepID=A0A0C3DJC3_9AGAM|nr:hypothetical protein SCLCIDRAFT_10803 [Scleroderma citrinum Foug A]